MYFVYVYKSLRNGDYYKGLTDNFDRRDAEHSNGKSVTTRNLLPLRLVHVEFCDTRNDARKLEKFFKSGFGREIIHQIDEELK